jgi:multicomponent Na+:H+ antiporter subunit G
MSEIQGLLAIVLIESGLVLMFTGSLGILRLPDFYCRAHASGKADTLGIMVLLAGIAVYEGLTLTSAKLLIAMLFIGLTNPVPVHALARAAMRLGLKPWFRGPTPESPAVEPR